MSGAEVLGLISAIITIVESSIKLYNTIKDSSGVPEDLRDVASRLPLVRDILAAAANGLQEDYQAPESFTALETVLSNCNDKVTQLQQIFESMAPLAESTRRTKFIKAWSSRSDAKRARTLIEGISGDLQLITFNHVVRASTRKQIETLITEIQSDYVDRDSPVTLHNAGQGRQFVHTGHGNQNALSGTATQVNGTFNSSTFNFSI